MNYHVRVSHELGFYSFYDVEADDRFHAAREAERRFVNQFCNGERYRVEAYVFVDWIAEAKREREVFIKKYGYDSQ